MVSTMKVSASDHPIKSVTIFKSSKAEIVRTFALELQPNQNKIEIKGLPSTIDTHSVRVSGLGGVRLFDVVCTIGGNKASYDHDSPAEIIRVLSVKKKALENEKRVRGQESDMLVNYAKTLYGDHVSPIDMARFLQSFVEQGRNNFSAIAALEEQIVEINRRIESVANKANVKKGSANGEVTIVVGSEIGSNVELKLTYIVSDASWDPSYELHATTENGKPSLSVSLHYRARISQSTGEDWTDTALTLSTFASDTMAKSIPQLSPLKIKPQVYRGSPPQRGGGPWSQEDKSMMGMGRMQMQMQMQMPEQQRQQEMRQQIQQQQQPRVRMAQTPRHQLVAVSIDGEEDEYRVEEGDFSGGFSEPATVVSETPLAISYSVEGKSTIPSDGIAHQASVSMLPFEAKISHVVIPRIEPQVYLQCEVKNTSEYRLLPGPVSVILDESYVSKTSINDINKGDTFDCTLGADSSAKVTYSRTSRTAQSGGGAFSEISKTVTYNTKITVQNKHQFAISDLIVREVVPMCDDKRIKVILRKPEGLANAKEGQAVDLKKDGLKVMWEKLVEGKGGEKEGRFEWQWKVESGAKVTLEAEWDIKAPADTQWVESLDRSGQEHL